MKVSVFCETEDFKGYAWGLSCDFRDGVKASQRNLLLYASLFEGLTISVSSGNIFWNIYLVF